MTIMKKSKTGSLFLAYTLIGGAIGATVGLLLAPQSGAETREKIIETMKERGGSIGSGLKSAQERLQKTGERLGSSTQRLMRKGRTSLFSEGKDAVAEAIDAAKQAYLEEKDAWTLKRQ